jgi:uncharacterized protein YjbI with pentapeptide repeats
MANDDHIAKLKEGATAWNGWRKENIKENMTPVMYSQTGERLPPKEMDLSGADLSGMNLSEANLSEANLSEANLKGASLYQADLRHAYLNGANLSKAKLSEANLWGASLCQADLREALLLATALNFADLSGAKLSGADLKRANLNKAMAVGADFTAANLSQARLWRTNLSEHAILRGAYLDWAYLTEADFSEADLRGADLRGATMVGTKLTGADLTGCYVYGVAAWNLKLDRATQRNLVITGDDEPKITVDNIEVAQFIYLMLRNEKIREVIDTITSKAVLILGRFTEDRKPVLEALREELRRREYLPILFDFDKPSSRNTDETITLLARMARFIVADISDAKSVLQELRAIVPDVPSLPVQPIILAMQDEPGMFDFYRNFRSFLKVHRYTSQEELIADLGEKVIRPAELKVLELSRFNLANGA